MSYNKEKAIKRAKDLLATCIQMNTTYASLAALNGVSKEGYRQILVAGGLLSKYKEYKKTRVRNSPYQEKELLRLLAGIEKEKSDYALRKVTRKQESLALIERCVSSGTSICRLAKLDGVTPRSFILKLLTSGTYDIYKERMQVPAQYKILPATIEKARLLLARCKELGVSWTELGKRDGYKSGNTYYQLLITTGLIDDYNSWMWQKRIDEINKKLRKK